MRASEIADMLSRQAEAVAQKLLPDGKREGNEWVCGDVDGSPGKSLKVCVHGSKSGVWKDFSEGSGGDLLSLWAATGNIAISEAMREAEKYLGVERTELHETSKPKPIQPSGEFKAHSYLEGRGISAETQRRYKVLDNGNEVGFPYYFDDQIVACKYRDLRDDKGMRAEKGGASILFGWQAMPKKQRSVVICEGEIDALSWFEMGYPAMSIPAGAGSHGWIESEFERLERFDKIYIAMDADDKGRASVAPILERLGRERCFIIDTGKYKDSNEALQAGEQGKQFIDSATWKDPQELREASKEAQNVIDIMTGKIKTPSFKTPFGKLDGLVEHRENELTIVNGINGHGKSQYVGQSVLAALDQGWKTVIYSGEMLPARLLSRMARQATCESVPNERKINSWFERMGKQFWLFNLTQSAKSDRLLKVFEYAHKRYGAKLFVVDSLLKCGIGEDDYNGQKLFVERLCDFKNKYPVHILLVTHSRKGLNEDAPTGKMDVRGAGAITDLADTVMTLWRNKPKEKAKYDNEGYLPANFDGIKSDALLAVSKQRNGDWENSAGLWWNWKSQQFVESENTAPKPYYAEVF